MNVTANIAQLLCTLCNATFANPRLLYGHQLTSHGQYLVAFDNGRRVEFSDIVPTGVRCFCGQIFIEESLFDHAQNCDFCLAKADEPFARVDDWDNLVSENDGENDGHDDGDLSSAMMTRAMFADSFDVIEDVDMDESADLSMTDHPTLLSHQASTVQVTDVSSASEIMPAVSSAVMRLLEDPTFVNRVPDSQQLEQPEQPQVPASDSATQLQVADPSTTGIDGIVEPPVLKAIGMVVYKPLGLLICEACQCTIAPHTMITHLKKEHSRLLFSEFLNAEDGYEMVCVYASQKIADARAFVRSNKAMIWPFEMVKEAILRLPKPSDPVPLLNVRTRRGFSCKACGTVHFNRLTFKKHLPECPALGNADKEHLDLGDLGRYLQSHSSVQRVWSDHNHTLYISIPSPTTTPDGSDLDIICADHVGFLDGLPEGDESDESDESDSGVSDREEKPAARVQAAVRPANPQVAPRFAASLRVKRYPPVIPPQPQPKPTLWTALPRNLLFAAARLPQMTLQTALVAATYLFDTHLLNGMQVRDLTVLINGGLADNMRCGDDGYSFLSDPRNRLGRYKYTLQQHLSNSQLLSPSEYQLMDPLSDEYLVCRYQLCQWLSYASQFIGILVLCMQLDGVTQGSGVSPEDIRICNGAHGKRNMFATLNTLIVSNVDITTGYVPSPRYMLTPLASLIIQYLTVVRPMEMQAMTILHKRTNPDFFNDATAAYSMYLFVCEGRRVAAASY